MQFSFKAADPEKQDYTLTVTMPLHLWRRLKQTLDAGEDSSHTPQWHFRREIALLVKHAEQHFTSEVKSEGE